MQTTYGRGEGGPGIRHIRTRRARGRQPQLGPTERRRLAQLLVCAVLFLAALIGKGVLPQQMQVWRQDALELIREDTDFKAVFVGLGRAISEGEPILDALGEIWIDAFGAGSVPRRQAGPAAFGPVYQRELEQLSATQAGVSRLLLSGLGSGQGATPAKEEAAQAEGARSAPETAGIDRTELAVVTQPAVLDPEPKPVYTGKTPPENCVMEQRSLGLKDTVTPVMGVISSGFGYRTHPVDGEYKFHYGTDIVADVGTPVLAFADGTVDFIGESDAYGQYIQLRHAGGVTTFYAHCSKLLAKQGQKVVKGQKIALVGQTGNTTGPHLHLEVRLDGTYLNPIYYIQHD